MIVVSDTSPVLNLARIGRLELLPLLYEQVFIPSAVYQELTASKRDLPPAIDLASQPWLIVASANDQQRVLELRQSLDPGEAEAIALALIAKTIPGRHERLFAFSPGIAFTFSPESCSP